MADASGEPLIWEDGGTDHIISSSFDQLGQWYIADFRAELMNPGWPPTPTPINIANTTWRVG